MQSTFVRIYRARVRALRRDARDRLIQAHQTASLLGLGKVPKLDGILAKFDRATGGRVKRAPVAVASAEEIEANLEAWVRSTGG